MRNPALTLLLVLGLTACAAPPLPEDHYYRLELGPPAAPAQQPRLAGTLSVQRIRMEGVYGERPLLYSTANAPTELRQYHYHYWADAPARLIQDQLAAWLRASRIARDANLPASGAAADYDVGGTVQRFEQHLAGGSAHAVAEIELALYRKAGNAPLFSRTYRSDIPARDTSPLAASQALGQALAQCVAQFVVDLRTVALR